MATRIFCDHCGNVIKEANVLNFGPIRTQESHRQQLSYAAQLYAAQQNAQQSGLVGIGWQPPLRPTILDTIHVESIDLCNTCVPIWMTRVRNLTKASDPE